MRRTALGIALLPLGLALLAAAEAGAQNAKKAKKDSGLVPAGKLTGKIVAVDESKRGLRINVGQRTINPVARAALESAQKAMRQARTREDKLAAAAQLQAAYKDLWVNDVELTTTDDVVIRVAQPPAQFDEKGRVKRYTQKELRELKGDPKLPGYQGDFANLRQNQIVQVTLVKKKEAMVKGRDADIALAADNLPMISMVIVIAEPAN